MRTIIQRRFADTPEHLGGPSGDSEDLLVHVFGSSEGTGLIGPGADALGRTALTEVLTCDLAGSKIVMQEEDLKRLFGDAFAIARSSAGTRVHMLELLEETIEYIEAETGLATPNDALSSHSPSIIWFVTPGQHADVVHHVLRQQRTTQVIALVFGAWPHGPTHFIAADGPRRLPPRPIELLTADQAVGKLCAFSGRGPT